jgi:hypothetical protein
VPLSLEFSKGRTGQNRMANRDQEDRAFEGDEEKNGEGRETARPAPGYRPISLLLAAQHRDARDWRWRALSPFIQSRRGCSC